MKIFQATKFNFCESFENNLQSGLAQVLDKLICTINHNTNNKKGDQAMTLVRWNPAKELLNVEREFNKIWNSFNNRFGAKNNEEYDNAVWAPMTDVSEDKDNFYLLADLPGVTKEDLKLSFNDGQLTISGERKQEKEENGKTFHRVERSYGKYYRSFNLPEKILAEKIKAEFKDGQLTVTVPKSEEAKPKELEIKIN